MSTSTSSAELFFEEFGTQHPSSTILLLHGLGSSHYEFTETGIASSLSSSSSGYHVLCPDLPGHSGSANCGPYAFDNITTRLASLIQQHGKNGKVHVFGFSGGGTAALHLAKYHPELVNSLVLSGAQDQISAVGYYTTFLAPGAAMIEKYLVPSSMVKVIQSKIGFTVPEIVGRESRNNQNYEMLKTAWVSLREAKLPGRSEPSYWQLPMRSLALAGEKQDHVKGVQELGRALRRGNAESRAGKIPSVPHWWFLNRPQLLVNIITAWIEQRELPEVVVMLDTA
jgi:pimeloyl-ACP methyl ester carboxylesterase